jgi:hypothetical protein
MQMGERRADGRSNGGYASRSDLHREEGASPNPKKMVFVSSIPSVFVLSHWGGENADSVTMVLTGSMWIMTGNMSGVESSKRGALRFNPFNFESLESKHKMSGKKYMKKSDKPLDYKRTLLTSHLYTSESCALLYMMNTLDALHLAQLRIDYVSVLTR